MEKLRIYLFKKSLDFKDLLIENNVNFNEIEWQFKVMNAPSTIEILIGSGGVLTTLATIISAWLKTKSNRHFTITYEDNKVYNAEAKGYSVEEVKQLLSNAKDITFIDENT